MPLRVAAHLPIVTSVLDQTATNLAAEGRAARVESLGRLEAVARTVLGSAEVGRAVDNALAGPLPEMVARSLVERHVIQRVVEEILERADVEAVIADALEQQARLRLQHTIGNFDDRPVDPRAP